MKPAPAQNEADERAYQRHADTQETAAALAWKEHLAGLTEEQRLDYERRGLIESPAAKKKSTKAKTWTRVEADEERGILRELQIPKEEQPDEIVAAKEAPRADPTLEAVRLILAEVIDAVQPRLEASLFAVVIGIGMLQGINALTLAVKYNLPLETVEAMILDRYELLAPRGLDLTLPKYVVSHVLDDDRPRLQADTFAMALGFPLRQGKSERRLAVEYGLTVATLSARVIWWVKHMDARLPGVCKRNTDNYRARNVRRQPDDPFRAKP